MPDWLFADSLSLLDLTEHLARMLARDRGCAELVTVAVSRRDRWVDLDLIWRGEPVPAMMLEAWLDAPFEGRPRRARRPWRAGAARYRLLVQGGNSGARA